MKPAGSRFGIAGLLVLSLAGCAGVGPAAQSPASSPGAPAQAPASQTTTAPSRSPATPPPFSDGLPPDGTWQVQVAEDDFVAAGWPADINPPGTYTWTFADGRATIELNGDDGSSAFCEANMSPLDGHVRFDYDPAGGDCGDLEEVVAWELAADGLHLFLISTSSPYADSARAQLETKPWQSTAAVVSTVTPGMVDIGGRSLLIECRGTGSPTVVFLAGTRMPRMSMRGIEDALLDEGSVRVCDYDRAGEGRSDPAAEPQDDLDVVDDLAALLDAADIEPPYVLVGHSLGGDQTWLYADRHPEGVAGFMLMNAGFFELDWDALHDVWSQAEIDEERALSEAGLGSVKQAATPPKDVPYLVMLSTIAQCGSTSDVCGRIYPFYEAWAQELADRTSSGRMVSVAAGHEIYATELDRVVEELELLLEEIG